MAPIDPDGGHSQALGGDVVVVEALRDVEDLFAGGRDRGECELEVLHTWFVAPRFLRGDDPIEAHAKPLVGCGEQIVVTVRDDGQLEALPESTERGGGVRERRPVTDTIGETARGIIRDSNPEVVPNAENGLGEDVAVQTVIATFGRALVNGESLEQLLIACRPALGMGGAKRGQDAGLPIN